jgi:hypothetical protein
MNTREKLLAGGLGLALAAWQVPSLVNSTVFQPVEDRQTQITDLQQAIEKKENLRRRQRKAVKDLAELGKRSLPPDPVIAANVFQNWLQEAADQVKLKNVVVERPAANNQKKGNTYFTVNGVLKGEGDLGQVTALMDEFQKSGLLVRITNSRLETKQKTANPILKVEMQVQALALLQSPKRTTLWVGGREPGPLPEAQTAPQEVFDQIAQKNLFARGYNGPPRPPEPPPVPSLAPPAPPPPPPPPTNAEFIFFVGSVVRNGKPDAFLYDRTSNQQTVLKPGQPFKAGGFEGTVAKVTDRAVTLRIGEENFRLELGSNLSLLQKLASAVPIKPANPESPGTERPSAPEEPTGDAAASGKPASDTPSAAVESATDTPPRDKSDAGKPAESKPDAKKFATQQPVPATPADENPGQEQPKDK